MHLKNIADFKGFERLTAIALEAVNDYEFNRIYPRVTSPSSDVHEITFENINLEVFIMRAMLLLFFYFNFFAMLLVMKLREL